VPRYDFKELFQGKNRSQARNLWLARVAGPSRFGTAPVAPLRCPDVPRYGFVYRGAGKLGLGRVFEVVPRCPGKNEN